jgi:hypothetical protein
MRRRLFLVSGRHLSVDGTQITANASVTKRPDPELTRRTSAWAVRFSDKFGPRRQGYRRLRQNPGRRR